MTNKKSKVPDLNELTSFAGKLFKDLKNSVGEIVDEYKKNRQDKPKPKQAAGAQSKKTPTAKKTSDSKTTASKTTAGKPNVGKTTTNKKNH